MASTYSPLLRFEKIAPGEQAGLWGDTTNQNIGTLIEQAIAGVSNVDLTSVSGNFTLTVKNGIVDQARSAVINCIGTAAATVNLIIPTSTKLYVIRNNCGQTIFVKTAAQTPGYELASGESNLVFCNGAEALAGFVTAGAATTPVSGGGTGVTSFTAGYLKSLGGTTALTTVAAIPAADISGQLSVANGGTGVASLAAGGLLVGNGTGAVTSLVGGVNGYVPTWSTASNTWVSTAPSAAGVTSIIAGPGISVNQSVGAVQITNTSTVNTVNPVFSSSVTAPIHYIGGSPGSMYIQNNGGEMGFVVNGLQYAKVTSSGLGAEGIASNTGITALNGYITCNQPGSFSRLGDNSVFFYNAACNHYNNGSSFGWSWAGSTIALLLNGGSNYNLTGTYGTISDERVKENITPARSYLSDLCKLEVIKYSLKSEQSATPTKLGFVAQQVEKVMPGLVEEYDNEDEGITDFKSIKTSIMIPMLVQAIQELKTELDAAKAEIAALKAK